MFFHCCYTRPRKKMLTHGTSVEGPPEESLRESMNTVQSVSSNGGIWSVRLSERVENSNVWAYSRDEAIRLAQWYAYLDYKDLKSIKGNE